MTSILMVEDDPDIAEACRVVLGARGFDVSWVRTLDEGFARLGKHAADLLILDVFMEEPGDGMEAAESFRHRGFAGPVLMLTNIACATGFVYRKGRTPPPVDAFQEKPVEPGRLVAVIEALLSGHTCGRAAQKLRTSVA